MIDIEVFLKIKPEKRITATISHFTHRNKRRERIRDKRHSTDLKGYCRWEKVLFSTRDIKVLVHYQGAKRVAPDQEHSLLSPTFYKGFNFF